MNKKSVLPIILYVLAVLIGVYSIFTMYSSYTYILGLVEIGSVVVSEQLTDVISYSVSASLPYIFYAVATGTMGYIISKVNEIKYLLQSNVEKEVGHQEVIVKYQKENLDESAVTDEEIIKEEIAEEPVKEIKEEIETEKEKLD